jgi:hypothetical protein
MIHFGIHIRIEAIFLRVRFRPGGWRLLLNESNLDDRLDALESVFPRNNKPDGRAVLIGKYLSVQTHTEKREGMHRFVDPETLNVGKRNCPQTAPQAFVSDRRDSGMQRICT